MDSDLIAWRKRYTKPLPAGHTEYRVVGLNGEAESRDPNCYAFYSPVPDLETHPELWQQNCPWTLHRGVEIEKVHPNESVIAATAMVATLLGETVVTNDRVLNHALSQAASIIGRRDISPLDKFETLTAFVLKARRELLGKADE